MSSNSSNSSVNTIWNLIEWLIDLHIKEFKNENKYYNSETLRKNIKKILDNLNNIKNSIIYILNQIKKNYFEFNIFSDNLSTNILDIWYVIEKQDKQFINDILFISFSESCDTIKTFLNASNKKNFINNLSLNYNLQNDSILNLIKIVMNISNSSKITDNEFLLIKKAIHLYFLYYFDKDYNIERKVLCNLFQLKSDINLLLQENTMKALETAIQKNENNKMSEDEKKIYYVN